MESQGGFLVAVLVGAAMLAAGRFALILCMGVLASTIMKTVQSGAASAEHWSPRRGRLELSTGPFRDSPLTNTQARGAPLWLRLAAGVGVGGGALTTGLIAPMLVLAAANRVSAARATFIILAAVSGLPAGCALLVSARQAVKGKAIRYAAFLGVHYITAATVVVACAPWGSTGTAYACAYGALGLLLTLAFARAHRLPGASGHADPDVSRSLSE